MVLTLVDAETFDYRDPDPSTLCELESDHLPAVGDLIKAGHRRCAFTIYRVEGRVFHTRLAKHGRKDFSRVYLMVTVQARH